MEKKLLKTIGNKSVYLVDGESIRRDTEIDFTDFGQHYRFSFIPANEIWIDEETKPEERKFFIQHALAERELMKRGEPYEKALEIADRVEKAERNKVRRQYSETDGPADESIYVRLWKTFKDVKIYLIDGEMVRELYDPQFVYGGHGLVYDYVPKNEVWLEEVLNKHERKYILLHELYERCLMKHGIPYEEAHDDASEYEQTIMRDDANEYENE